MATPKRAGLQRRDAERELDDTYGGRLYAAAAQDPTGAPPAAPVWAEVSDDEWRRGAVTGIDTQQRKLLFADDAERRIHRVTPARVLPCNPALLDSAEDLTALSHLHAPGVLHHLQRRYAAGQIYTASGPILIALNPYARVASAAPEVLAQYLTETSGGGVRAPHVYAIGEQAYRALRAFQQNQSVLVTGESGAGKTETTKILLQYFASKGGHGGAAGIEQRVLGTTSILESFGNAKTLRNDNSSRFGKFILIEFDEAGAVAGAQLRTYLLEKARLTHQSTGERSYHVFYQLLAYCAEEPRGLPSAESWSLLAPGAYRFLAQSGGADDTAIDGVDDAAQFRVTLRALATIGMALAEVDRVCGVLVGLLALGNVQFEESAREEAQLVRTGARDWLGEAAILLGVNDAALLSCLTTRTIASGRGESIVKVVRAADAEVARDSLAVFLYECLFAWLVDRINEAVRPPVLPASPRGPAARTLAALGTHRARGASTATRPPPPRRFIGVLDIYGFETFETNSFEQFCINYANEKLQHQFNQHMFKLEQEEYEREGVDWRRIAFADNSGCIHHIEGQLGVIDLLNEETRLNGSADNFVHKLSKKPARASYVKDDGRTKARAEFGIKHYPGSVTYDASAFIDKNRSAPPADFLALVLARDGAACANPLVYTLCSGYDEVRKAAAAGKKDTVATQFKDSLAELMATIATTQPNYIRCVKPNDRKEPLGFVPARVLEQLRCGGVMEAIRIAQAGYPSRMPYTKFGARYVALAEHAPRAELWRALEVPETTRDAARVIVQDAAVLPGLANLPECVQFGATKLFLKASAVGRLEEALAALQARAATALQSRVRAARVQERFAAVRAGLVALQALARARLAARELGRRKEARAALVLQSLVRGALARTAYAETRRREKAAVVLQARVRAAPVQGEFERARAAAVAIQRCVRAQGPRRRLAELREEARSMAGMLARLQAREERSDVLQAQLAEAGATINTLTAECARLRAALAQRASAEECDALSARIQALEADLDESRRKEQHTIDYMGLVLGAETARAQAAEDRAAEVEAQQRALRAYADDMAGQVHKLQQRALKRATRENGRVQELESDVQTRAALLQAALDNAEMFTAKIAALEAKLTAERAEHEAALIAEGRARADLELACDALRAEQEELRGALADAHAFGDDEVTAAAERACRALEERTLELDESRARLELVQAELTAATERLAAQAAARASREEELRATIDTIQRENDTLKGQKRASATHYEGQLAAAAAQHEARLLAETARAEAALVQVQQLSAQLEPVEQARASYEERCAALTRALEEARRSAAEAADEASRMRDAALHYEADVKAERKRAIELEGSLEQVRRDTAAEAARLRAELAELTASGAAFHERVMGAVAQARAARDARAVLPSEQALDRLLAARMSGLAGQVATLTDAALKQFAARESTAAHASATPPAVLILARWMLRQRTSWKTTTLAPCAHRLLAAAPVDAPNETLVWLFKVAAALYAFVRSGSAPSATPATLDLEMHWRAPPPAAKAPDGALRTRAADVSIFAPPNCTISTSLASELQFAAATLFARLAHRPAHAARKALRKHVAAIAPADATEAAAALFAPLEAVVALLQQHCVLPSVTHQLLQVYAAVCDAAAFNALLKAKAPALASAHALVDAVAHRMHALVAREHLFLLAGGVSAAALFPYTTQLLDAAECDQRLLASAAARRELAPDLTVNQLCAACALAQRAGAPGPAAAFGQAALEGDAEFRAGAEVRLDDVYFTLDTQRLHVLDAADAEHAPPPQEAVESLIAFLHNNGHH